MGIAATRFPPCRGSNTLYFTYDASGVPMSVTYGNATYYYVTNVQGDVTGILNSSGALVVSYTYDAWGNQLSCTGTDAATLGAHNPLRYRGYIFDQETGLYYLQSRYYDPEIGRFINADSQISGVGGNLLGNNMFAYCMNNPVSMSDSIGEWPIWAIVAVVVAAVVTVSTVINHVVNAVNKKKIDKEIKKTSTTEEATEEINDILEKYSDECQVTFDLSNSNNEPMVEISNSYLVTSRYDRQKISAIISSTGVTSRQYDDMSSEWLVHNWATPVLFLYEKAHSVGIDYNGDYRWYVRVLGDTLEIFGWE